MVIYIAPPPYYVGYGGYNGYHISEPIVQSLLTMCSWSHT